MDKDKLEINLESDALEKLIFQSYDPQPQIDGVFYKPLKKHAAMEGSFMEFMRVGPDGKVEGLEEADFNVRQVSVSHAEPQRVNAFHVHPKVVQDEFWCVISGKMLIWLADVRADSPTCGVKRSFTLTGDSPAILYIPAGVAHGYKSGPAGATLLYTMNSQFDISDPNEGRLSWDFFGSEIWEDDRG